MVEASDHDAFIKKTESLNILRQKIRRYERLEMSDQSLRFDISEIDDFFPNGLPRQAVHEFLCAEDHTLAATIGFLSFLLTQLSSAPVLWISRDPDLYAPGLAAFYSAPEQFLFVQTSCDRESLWATEEALRCKCFAAVIADIRSAELNATRRLQLASEQGATGFLLRREKEISSSSSCVSRWKITPRPSEAETLPGLGRPRWHVDLLRLRGGKPAQWLVEHNSDGLQVVYDKEHSALADRAALSA